MEWDYINRYVHVSIPGYCEKACQRFHHHKPKKPQDQPYAHIEPTYGAKQQYAQEEDQYPTLSKEDKTFIQEVIGVFLYYARAVDCTMLAALGSFASQQATPTENTMKKVKQFLDYAATHQDATITYRASDMIIAVHSDVSYLSETNARSRAGGHFFLSENDEFPNQQWSSTYHCTNHQSSHVISIRGRNWSSLHKFQRSNTTETPSRRNGTSSTTNTNPN